MQAGVSSADRERLDQYFTAVRDVEKDLTRAEGWVKRPKPKVSEPSPEDPKGFGMDSFHARIETMLKIACLALQTDSTRFITLKIGYLNAYHHDSHHGQVPEALAKVRAIETKELQIIRDFLVKLQNTREGGETLLDRTMRLYGSNLGDANRHDTVNLPILLAGGGFKHGQHLAFDRQNNTPLCNLYVSMLQRLGIETDRFASSTGRLSGLEAV